MCLCIIISYMYIYIYTHICIGSALGTYVVRLGVGRDPPKL